MKKKICELLVLPILIVGIFLNILVFAGNAVAQESPTPSPTPTPTPSPTSNPYTGVNGGTTAPASSNGMHSCGGVNTAIISCSDSNDGSAIFEILATALSVFTFGVGAAAVVGMTISAYQYITARDNGEIVKKAKNRMVQIVFGLLLWAMIWVILELLLPGGLLGNPS